MEFDTTIEKIGVEPKEVVSKFLKDVGAEVISDTSFKFKDKLWHIDFHPFDHSDDIIITVDIINKYDNYLLVKTGGNRVRIVGVASKEELLSTPAKDIYRNGKMFHMVVDSNLNDLRCFELKRELKKRELFIINQQKADSIGEKEYNDGVLAGIHYFAKEGEVYFKDINQKDEFMLGDKKCKIYTRGAASDEDILIPEDVFQKRQDIDIYISCKIKGGAYWYVGYVTRAVVQSTRIVQMINADSAKASDEVRRMFAEQYAPISDLIELYEEEKEAEVIIPQSYTPLHVHSEYSIGDGYGTIPYLVESIRKKGFKACALTDHGTMGGVLKFQKAMLEKDLKPIIGCEIYIKSPEYEKTSHQIVIVKNTKGWKNLLKLQDIGVRDHFYYKPVVPIEMLFKYSEGLIITSACSSGLINRLVADGKEELAAAYIIKYKSTWGDDFYGEMQLHNAVGNMSTMVKLRQLYDEHGIKMVFTTDAHYPYKEDKEYHEAVKAISWKKNYGEAGFDDDCFYLMTDDEIKDRLKASWMDDHIDGWKRNTNEIADKIDFKITATSESDTLPKMGETLAIRKAKLKDMCIKGLEKNTIYKYEGAVKDKLDTEIERILSKDFENYFLIVEDLIRWAKSQKIGVGPGRGSVGASLAAYALNITACDPIKFELLFDRFLSEIRRDMPDVDMDFQDSRRHEVFQYLRDTYGDSNSAKVVTYSRFHPKGTLRDIGRIFKIPTGDIERVCGLVLERSGGDARSSFGLLDTFAEFEEAIAFQKKYPQAVKIAIRLESHIRHKGVHAAAMVITEREICDYAPVHKVGSEIVVEFEKQEAEDMKLVKLDVLGLKTLSVIAECEKDTKVSPPTSFENKSVYKEVFENGNTAGVFQFETVGLSKLSKNIKINDFNLLYDATTLFRPGALHSGQTMQYVNRHHGDEDIVPAHPLLKGITEQTKGIILYQEQIMQIMNQVGGMSWAAAETVRKVITKSKGKKAFEEMRKEFVRNTKRIHGMEKEDSESLYDVVSTFGSYSFNKAHAVEYSIISYWCAWYKTFFPQEFFKAILKYANEDSKIADYLYDAKRCGIAIEYPEINRSEMSYGVYDNIVYSGLNSIKGIGMKTADKILANKPYTSLVDFKKRCKVSKKVLAGLITADAFRGYGINKKHELEGTEEDYTDVEWSAKVMELTTLNPKIDITKTFDFGDYDFTDIKDMDETKGDMMCFVRGIVTDKLNKDKLLRPEIKTHMHKFDHHMIYLNINDGSGNLAIQINPWTYHKYSGLLENITKKPVAVYGQMNRDGSRMSAQLVEISGETIDVEDFNKRVRGTGHAVITCAIPGVSKKGNSYYRIQVSNGVKGLCFKANNKLYAGMEVFATMSQPPFINLQVIK